MVKIFAKSMLTADGTLTAEQRAELTARADKVRVILGETAKQTINVPVFDCYAPDVKIGYMTYTL
jgi:IMP dehydrogenase/GMP reductase